MAGRPPVAARERMGNRLRRSRCCPPGAAPALFAMLLALAHGIGDAAGGAVGRRWLAGFFGGATRGASASARKRPSLVNASQLVQLVDPRSTNGSYVVANFFSSSCPFSAELAPLFDALPQLFDESQVRFVAMDAHADRRLNMRYSIQGYPTVLCFGPGRAQRYNSERPSLQSLVDFVQLRTKTAPLHSPSGAQLEASLHAESFSGADTRLTWVSALVVACVMILAGEKIPGLFKLWQSVAVRRRHEKEM